MAEAYLRLGQALLLVLLGFYTWVFPAPSHYVSLVHPHLGMSGSTGDALLTFLDTHYTAKKVWDYCWMNGEFFQRLDRTTFSEDTHQLVLAGFKDHVATGELAFWRMHMERLSDKHIEGIGGSSIHIIVKGPSLNRPKIFDLRNGTYIAAFRILDPGEYTATVSLRWQNCRGYVFCSEADYLQPVHFTQSRVLHVSSVPSSAVLHDFSTYSHSGGSSGRWILRNAHDSNANSSLGPNLLLEGDYMWRPWAHQERQSNFPTAKLENRFIYWIGDSLTKYAFQQLSRQILPQDKAFHAFINRSNGSVMSEYIAGLSMELWYYTDLNVTLAYTWYPENYPVGGGWTTNFPLVDSEKGSVPAISVAHFHVAEWISFLRNYMSKQPFLPAHFYPDAVIFNFGLHFASQLDPPIYEILLRNMLLRLRSEFPRSETKLIWRSTAYTHFDSTDLPEGWKCRCPGRIEVLNDVAAGLVSALDIPTVDFTEISATRADAAPDNRHYTLSNVRATYNNILLNHLDSTF